MVIVKTPIDAVLSKALDAALAPSYCQSRGTEHFATQLLPADGPLYGVSGGSCGPLRPSRSACSQA